MISSRETIYDACLSCFEALIEAVIEYGFSEREAVALIFAAAAEWHLDKLYGVLELDAEEESGGHA